MLIKLPVHVPSKAPAFPSPNLSILFSQSWFSQNQTFCNIKWSVRFMPFLAYPCFASVCQHLLFVILSYFFCCFSLFAFVLFLWYFFVLSISAPCLSFPLRKEILLPHICGCKLSKWHPIILLLHPVCRTYKKRASAYWQKPRLSVPFADLPETHLICFSNI